ncbi:MAG: leucyl aminopeptidase [Armatimonadota bacterium]
MQIEFLAESALKYVGDAIIVGVAKGAPLQGPAAEVDAALGGLISRCIASGEIRGRQSEVTVLHRSGILLAERVAVVGLGEQGGDACLAIRRAAGAAARVLRDRGCRRLGVALHLQAPPAVRPDLCIRAIIEGVHVGLYRGDECKASAEAPAEVEALAFVGMSGDEGSVASAAAKAGSIAGDATNYARRLVNLPANIVTPGRLAREANDSAQAFGLEVEVLGAERIAELGMGAFAAVARGSDEPACLIILRHRRQQEGPHVAFVGKGLTFDSGGLSLKPADKMELMKQDMAGGAAVLAAMRAVAQLGLELNVTGIVPATENLPSGHAFRPGDVVTAMNGKTVEVISTDAEGRLILADALGYACQLGATHIVDVATLTGACIIALGHVAAGVMGNDTALVEAVLDAGERAGERMWRLPLFPEYRAQLESKVADLKNVGGRAAGTIIGGWFLREFVGDTAWVHIDIAGTAWSEKDEPHQIEGGTGAAVRTLTALAERMAGGER